MISLSSINKVGVAHSRNSKKLSVMYYNLFTSMFFLYIMYKITKEPGIRQFNQTKNKLKNSEFLTKVTK